ncbi:MAG TPA: transposase [Alphaproteobacteria bacterium]|nr:transposase [Alphaproteobacteria bacterium]
MNVLPFEVQTQVIGTLTQGVSIRATERLTGVHRDTIMRLGARVGMGCADLHDKVMQNVRVPRIELDEAWSYVGCKQRRVKSEDGDSRGDQYIFLALDAISKGIIAFRVGKRNAENTRAFIGDLRLRVLGEPEISSDGFYSYPPAIEGAFGVGCHYGTIEKHYKHEPASESSRRYSPGYVVAVTKSALIGRPKQISTSLVERQNLTLRMEQRRFTRLTNGFSKKLENHVAAVALYVAHYNLCRVHGALRVTPAMHLGLVDHIWSVGELIEAALTERAVNRALVN